MILTLLKKAEVGGVVLDLAVALGKVGAEVRAVDGLNCPGK